MYEVVVIILILSLTIATHLVRKETIGKIVLVLFIGIGGYNIYRIDQTKRVYLKFLMLSNENSMVYVNSHKIIQGNKVIQGLKKVKAFRGNVRGGTIGECTEIKIINKNSGIKICLQNNAMSNYYYHVFFQEYYLNNSGWESLYFESGTLTKKYIKPYIEKNKESLNED